jgi:D-arabinose 1-dehydrogenase-like Zn-dependent alcohol dehydrogenase
MNRARASVLEAFGQPLVARKYPQPGRLEPEALMVRTEMAGICGTDVHL